VSQAVRVQNFMVSSDGYGSGVGQSLEHPIGHANPSDQFSGTRRGPTQCRL